MTPLKNPRSTDREYRRLLDLIIGGMAELTSSRLSGDDSPYDNPWLEYAAQVQGQHSFAFGLYEELLRRFCDAQAANLPDPEVRLLWNGTQDCRDWSEDGLPHLDLQREHISDELCRRLECEAANEKLPRLRRPDQQGKPRQSLPTGGVRAPFLLASAGRIPSGPRSLFVGVSMLARARIEFDGSRWNNLDYTRAFKQAARARHRGELS